MSVGDFKSITNAPGLGGGRRAPPPQFRSKFERDFYRLREEHKRTQDELRKTERTLEKYAFELQKTQEKAKIWYDTARDAQNEVRLSRNAEKIHVSNAFLDKNIFALLSALDALKDAVNVTSKFLDGNVIFRTSEAFSHEIEAAQRTVQPFLGAVSLKLFSAQASRASTTGSDTRGSRLLIRSVSQTVVYVYFNRAKDRTKAVILALYANIFRIASWALPGAANRSAFDAILGTVFSAGCQVHSAKEKIDTALNVSITCPFPGPTGSRYDHITEEAVNVEGQAMQITADADEDVVATLRFG